MLLALNCNGNGLNNSASTTRKSHYTKEIENFGFSWFEMIGGKLRCKEREENIESCGKWRRTKESRLKMYSYIKASSKNVRFTKHEKIEVHFWDSRSLRRKIAESFSSSRTYFFSSRHDWIKWYIRKHFDYFFSFSFSRFSKVCHKNKRFMNLFSTLKSQSEIRLIFKVELIFLPFVWLFVLSLLSFFLSFFFHPIKYSWSCSSDNWTAHELRQAPPSWTTLQNSKIQRKTELRNFM